MENMNMNFHKNGSLLIIEKNKIDSFFMDYLLPNIIQNTKSLNNFNNKIKFNDSFFINLIIQDLTVVLNNFDAKMIAIKLENGRLLTIDTFDLSTRLYYLYKRKIFLSLRSIIKENIGFKNNLDNRTM